jgi:hypothetical protein
MRTLEGYDFLLYLRALHMIVLFSCIFGRILTKRFVIAKLVLWLVGITASMFVFMYFMGTPYTIPTSNPNNQALWIISSIIPFVGFLLCFLLKKDTLEKKGFVTD